MTHVQQIYPPRTGEILPAGPAPPSSASSTAVPSFRWPTVAAVPSASGSRLIGPVVHEMRNFIQPMELAFGVLDRAALDEPSRRVLAALKRQVRGLERLVNDLLDLSRIDAGKLELRIERCTLQDVAHDAAELCAAAAHEHSHVLSVAGDGRPIWVDGDTLRLCQAVANLVLNAFRYTPAGGQVIIDVSQEDGRGFLRVRDCGAGMTAELVSKVFDPYAQGENGQPGRLGIGLHLVRMIAGLHGGEVTAHSDGQGRGSTFTMSLPLAAAPWSSRDGTGEDSRCEP